MRRRRTRTVLALVILAPMAAARCGGAKDDVTAPPLAADSPRVVLSSKIRVELGSDGRLVYHSDSRGDVVPDFSHAGYGGGGVRLPDVPTVITLTPLAGDDGANIQAALNAAGNLAPDASGFRGAVLLKAGTYEIGGSVTLNRSGVVLRGEGQGTEGTVLRATGTGTRDLIRIAGTGSRREVEGSRRAVTASYVPVGATRVPVADGTAFAVGDAVVVYHQTNQDWLDAIGADACNTRGGAYDLADVDGMTCLQNPWSPSSVGYERKVVGVEGNTLVIDVPLVQALDGRFGGGAVAKYTAAGRIQKCGVENLRGESEFRSDTDNDHASYLVSLTQVEDAWVRDVTAVSFVQGAVKPGSGAKRVTVQDSTSLDPVSELTGGLRYPFHIDDCQLVLVQRCYSRNARHDFVSGSAVPGPNVFLDSAAELSRSDCGPHHRYATGTLYDNITHRTASRNQMLGVEQRGNSGTGHGWAGAQQMFWNCISDEHKVEQATPYFHNWSMGCRSTILQSHPAGQGEFESYQVPLNPRSLYLQQLQDRLGTQAVANIAR